MRIDEIISSSQIEAIQNQLRDSSWVNGHLRGRLDLHSRQESHVKFLDQVMRESPVLKSPMILYRGITIGSLNGEGQVSGQPDNGLKAGSVFTDYGYVSTTTSKKLASNPGYVHKNDRAILVIRVPAGSHVLRPSETQFDDKRATELASWEDEYLLARGCKFRIDKVNGRVIHVTLIHDGAINISDLKESKSFEYDNWWQLNESGESPLQYDPNPPKCVREWQNYLDSQKYTLENLPIRSLKTAQRDLEPGLISELAGKKIKPIWVFRTNEGDYIVNGNNRAASRLLNGETSITSRVYDFRSLQYDNWRLPNVEELKLEFSIKQKKPDYIKSFRRNYGVNIFDSWENFRKAIDQGRVDRLPYTKYNSIGRVTIHDSIDDIKAMTAKYAYLRDPDRIYNGFINGDSIPMPIIIDYGSGKVLIAGNTRLGVAFATKIHPYPKVLIIPNQV